MSETQSYKKASFSGFLGRVFERCNYTVKKPVQCRVFGVAPNIKCKLIEIYKGSEEVSLFLRLERRSDLIANIARMDAKFDAVGLRNGSTNTGKFTVAELANIDGQNNLSQGKIGQRITAASLGDKAISLLPGICFAVGMAFVGAYNYFARG